MNFLVTVVFEQYSTCLLLFKVNMAKLPYRFPPVVAFTIVTAVFALLTYGSLMALNGRGTSWYNSREHTMLDTVTLGALYSINDFIFGSDTVMIAICGIAWAIHFCEATYAFVLAKSNGGSLGVSIQYACGALLVGVLQLQVLTATIKRHARK